MSPDKVSLDLSDSPELAEVFGRKEPGEECKLTITATLDEVDRSANLALLSISEVSLSNSYTKKKGSLDKDAPVSKLVEEDEESESEG